MKITKIVPLKFKKSYRTLYFEGEDPLRIHEDLIFKHYIKEGTDLSDAEREAIKSEELIKEASEYAYLFLGMRARSEKEMSDRLNNIGFPSETIRTVIEDLRSKKFLDDAQFAKDFAEYKLKNESLGLNKVESDLMQKGIPKETIHHTIQNLTQRLNSDEDSRAYETLLRRTKQIKSEDSRALYRRLFDYLARRGFSFDTIEKALTRYKREGGFHDSKS